MMTRLSLLFSLVSTRPVGGLTGAIVVLGLTAGGPLWALPAGVADSLLGPSPSPALPSPSDAAEPGEPPRRSAEDYLKGNIPTYVREMLEDFRLGRLDRITVAAPIVLHWQPDHATALGLQALSLAVAGDLDLATAAIAAARAAGPPAVPDLCAEALMLARKNDPEAATRACRRAIELDANHPYPWNVLGRLSLASGHMEEAASHYAKAIALEPNFQPAHTNLGFVVLAKPDPVTATPHFREALRLAPGDGKAAYGLARALHAQNDAAGALLILAKSTAQPSALPEAVEFEARLLMETGQAEAAVKTGQRMLTLALPGAALVLAEAHLRAGQPEEAMTVLAKAPPDSEQARLLLANAAIATSQYDKAVEAVDRLLALNPNHFGGLVTRVALLRHQGKPAALPPGDPERWGAEPSKLVFLLQAAEAGTQGDWTNALTLLRKTEDIMPGFSVTGLEPNQLPGALEPKEMPSLALGVLLQIQGLRDAAIARYAEALKANPRSVLAHYFTAALLLEKKEIPSAGDHLTRSLEAAPRFFPSLYALGDMAMQARQADRAVDYLQRAYAVSPLPAIDLKLGVIFENTNRPAEAEARYRRFIDASPKLFIGYNQLAWLLASRGEKLDEALALATKADTLMPGNASILDTLGWITHLKGRSADAVEILTRALAVAPESALVHYHLGAAQLAAGRQDPARQHLEKSLSLAPETPEAGKVRALLESLKTGASR